MTKFAMAASGGGGGSEVHKSDGNSVWRRMVEEEEFGSTVV
jgi:hypothetical protein